MTHQQQQGAMKALYCIGFRRLQPGSTGESGVLINMVHRPHPAFTLEVEKHY
jgi:hypothetical protein